MHTKRNHKITIFKKTFSASVFMMLIITIIAYLLLYFLLPHYYENYKQRQLDHSISALKNALSSGALQDETDILSQFVQQNNCELAVFDQENPEQSIFNFTKTGSIVLEEDAATSNAGNEFSVNITSDSDTNITNTFTYEIAGINRNAHVTLSLQPLSEAKQVLIQIFPISGLICIIAALLLSLLFSHFFVTPIRIIQNCTKKMTELYPSIEIPIISNDEIGELSQDINFLYSELKGTIDALQLKLSSEMASENNKINFLRTLSHELKTPLASADALIEGILYDVAPYNEQPKKYLMECKEFLENAITLTKDSLRLSNQEFDEMPTSFYLKETFADIVYDYRLIMRSKQIRFDESINDCLRITTKRHVFSRALTNILSNAANYTDKGGYIHVYMLNANSLIIENTYSDSSPDSELSTGLGLKITEQLFQFLQLNYSLEADSERHIMQFTLDLTPVMDSLDS